MALALTKPFKGATVSYWKIIQMQADMIEGKTRVVVGMYVDLAARTADVKNILNAIMVVMPATGKTLAETYAFLKLDKEFLGATDC